MSVSVTCNNGQDLVEWNRLVAGLDPSSLQIDDGRHPDARHYAALIALHRITNFTFSYQKGCFTAVNARGEELASGETVRELLDSL